VGEGERVSEATPIRELLETVCARRDLTRDQAREVFARIVRGELSEVEIAALAVALKTKGEQPEEIAGAAEALRAAAVPFPAPDLRYADTCGTGGDGAHTVNISTAAAFVAAEAGVPVAKHGNRSVSSRCGSADVLEACGVTLTPTPQVAARCLAEAGVCFLMAPQYHSGLRHAAPVRRALKTRTVFNLLGPLVNPATPVWQVMGVYAPEYCAPLARTLGLLGCESALVVHGSGLDELALHGPTTAALWREGALTELELTPEEAGLERHPIEALAGGEPEENASWLRELLGGGGSEAHHAAVALQVAALLWVSGGATDLQAGAAQAREAIAGGGGLKRLEQLAQLSSGGGAG
jgi:anthranilate phosphoribosyltransferase